MAPTTGHPGRAGVPLSSALAQIRTVSGLGHVAFPEQTACEAKDMGILFIILFVL